MLTQADLAVYAKYHGDGDYFVRWGTAQEKAFLTYEKWILLESFLQDWELVEKGLVSDHFAQNFTKRLREQTDGEETRLYMKKLLGKF